MQLNGKNIVITGGSGAIGSLISKRIKEEGAKVIILDRVQNKELDSLFIEGDLSTPEGIEKAGIELQKHKVDILINLAGIQYFGKFHKQPQHNVLLGYMVNLLAPVMLTQAVLQGMIERKSGHIVNIGSIFGSINFAHFTTYSSSKAGLKGFSEALRREVKDNNIDVTYVAPRAVKTPLNSGKVMELAAKTKMNMDRPEDVAKRIVDSIISKKKDAYFGFPESVFVRVNALLPRIVDGALAKNDRIASQILEQN